jgi:AcrR family transcriptional regulator
MRIAVNLSLVERVGRRKGAAVADQPEAAAASERESDVAGGRRRPKDRKAQIVRVAARAFSERGYHPVGVDEIAAEIGISGPALYRHFPNKYALFAAAAERGPGDLLTGTEHCLDEADPRLRLTRLLDALIDVSIDNRRSTGLYRWERRYLDSADRKRLRAMYDEVIARIAGPLARPRPELSEADRDFLANGVLSVLGSLSAHRTVLSTARLHPLLVDMCRAVLRRTPPPLPPPPPDSPARPGRGLPLTSKRERLLVEAIRIIGMRGYHEASIDEIAAAAEVNPSSVYRYFPSKADLLAAAFHRAGDRVALAITEALAEADEPADALSRIAARYVRLSFLNPELFPLYFAEQGNLPAAEQSSLRAVQRQNALEWVHLLTDLGVAPIEARFRVHAALALVFDLGRLLRFDSRPQAQARVHTMMMAVLLDTPAP